MRIGYYIPGWPPGSMANGIVSMLGRLGLQLREMGHEVFYITPSASLREQDPFVTPIEFFKDISIIEKIRLKLNFESGYFREMSNCIADAVEHLVSEKHIDIFQMEETHGWAGTVIRRVPIPVVVRLHGPWFLNGVPMLPTVNSRAENRHRLEREGAAMRLASGLLAPSADVIERTQEFYGKFNCPTEVIPNPIPVRSKAERWDFDACDRDLILFVGRFDFHKGADILLWAFAKLAETRPRIKLIFVGPDHRLDVGDNKPLSFMEFVDKELTPAARARIDYRGAQPHKKIEKLRKQAAMCLVCSRYETFGNTVIEAMATGCPVIGTNVGGIPEILCNNRNGLLVPPEDSDALASAVGKLLDNPEIAKRLGAQAAADCIDRYDPRTIGQETINFYSKVIASRSRPL